MPLAGSTKGMSESLDTKWSLKKWKEVCVKRIQSPVYFSCHNFSLDRVLSGCWFSAFCQYQTNLHHSTGFFWLAGVLTFYFFICFLHSFPPWFHFLIWNDCSGLSVCTTPQIAASLFLSIEMGVGSSFFALGEVRSSELRFFWGLKMSFVM